MKENYSQKKPTATVLSASLDDMIGAICKTLDSGRSVELSLKGQSMLPMIREGKDSVILSPVTREIRKYDVVFYKRPDGSYVLHRVVKLCDDTVWCVGDNQFVVERGVPHSAIIAILESVRRDGALIEARGKRSMAYARIRTITRPVRYFLFRLKRKIKHLFTNI